VQGRGQGEAGPKRKIFPPTFRRFFWERADFSAPTNQRGIGPFFSANRKIPQQKTGL
jgi:hypothetical protein